MDDFMLHARVSWYCSGYSLLSDFTGFASAAFTL